MGVNCSLRFILSQILDPLINVFALNIEVFRDCIIIYLLESIAKPQTSEGKILRQSSNKIE